MQKITGLIVTNNHVCHVGYIKWHDRKNTSLIFHSATLVQSNQNYYSMRRGREEKTLCGFKEQWEKHTKKWTHLQANFSMHGTKKSLIQFVCYGENMVC